MKSSILAILLTASIGSCDSAAPIVEPKRPAVSIDAIAEPNLPPAPVEEVVASIQLALNFLEKDGSRWMNGAIPIQDGKGCVSCHHVGYALWSHREANSQVFLHDRVLTNRG